MNVRSFGRETKYQKVRVGLETLANRLSPYEKLPSVRALAVALDSSINTVSGALDDLECEQVIYRRHGVGIFVSPRRLRSVWLICNPGYFSQGQSPFWDVMLRQLRDRAQGHHLKLSLHFTQPAGDTDNVMHTVLDDEIRAGRVHGAMGIGWSRAAADWLIENSIPTVAFAGWAHFVVALDNEALIRTAVEQLALRGCRRIAFLKPGAPFNPTRPDDWPQECPFTAAFVEALQSQGLELDPSLVKNNIQRLQELLPVANAVQGYLSARELFSGTAKHPDGLVVTDDMMTQGVLMALEGLNLEQGRDYLLATHANHGIPILPGQETKLIRLEFDSALLVDTMFEMLETVMAKRVPEGTINPAGDANVRLIQAQLYDQSIL